MVCCLSVSAPQKLNTDLCLLISNQYSNHEKWFAWYDLVFFLFLGPCGVSKHKLNQKHQLNPHSLHCSVCSLCFPHSHSHIYHLYHSITARVHQLVPSRIYRCLHGDKAQQKRTHVCFIACVCIHL